MLYGIVNLEEKTTIKRGNDNIMRDKNQLKCAIDYEVRIKEDDPVRKLVEIFEKLDYIKLLTEYVRVWRKTNPIILFQLVVLGYIT